MKRLYILAAGLLSLLAACNKDDSGTGRNLAADVKVSGLQTTYTVYTRQDWLKIQPVVENEAQYDYYWTLFNNAFTPNQGLVKADTLARTKNLDYEVLKNPGSYILVFNVKNKETGVTAQFKSTAIISTLTMNGWYLLKDNGGQTDLDFIYPTGRIDNWIKYHNGASLSGNAVKNLFVGGFKNTITAPEQYSTMMVLSDNDAGIYRVDNGAMVMNFDNMFFSKPAVRKLQDVFQPTALNLLHVINDGKAYTMVKGTLFSNMPAFVGAVNYTNIDSKSAVVAMNLLWNKNNKSIFGIDNGNFAELKPLKGRDKLRNVNGDLAWMAGYPSNRGVAVLLFRNPQDSGYLYKIDGKYSPLAGFGSDTLILAQDTLSPQHSLMHADRIGGNYDVDLIYYSVGSKIYMTDIASQTENLQFTLPAGEVVTAIQHIKYPVPVNTDPNKVNKIAICTYKDGRYKVYLHTISSTGTLSAIPADFEGEGRVTSVMYMEQGNGTRVF
ncbi:MAG: PKD-like family lipoprotein [Pseudobacter sp.]|uniref:PKD-like family lipoprotein n=1 Tax=Pseudobacter sp. TaxID=2045420 RepID=UPI003F7D1BB1